MRRPRHAVGTVLAVLMALLVTTGCAGLPADGPVQTEQIQAQVEDEAPVDFTPGGPEPGAGHATSEAMPGAAGPSRSRIREPTSSKVSGGSLPR